MKEDNSRQKYYLAENGTRLIPNAKKAIASNNVWKEFDIDA